MRQVFVDDKVKRYAVDWSSATREPVAARAMPELANLIEYGASVRASINLIKVAKAHALSRRAHYISPHDVKTIAHDVLRHRRAGDLRGRGRGQDLGRPVIDVILATT